MRETRVSQTHGDDGSMAVAISSKTRKLSDLRYLPSAIYQLLKVPPFMFITFAGATEGMITSGFATFMPKFIQNQFGVTAGWASMLTGEWEILMCYCLRTMIRTQTTLTINSVNYGTERLKIQ